MFRESLEISAATVEEAKSQAMAALGVESPSQVEFEVLRDEDRSVFHYARRPARVRAVHTPSGFGRVARELPDSIPAPPPPERARPVPRLSPGAPKRLLPKPVLVIEESAPAAPVRKLGIEPSRAREREVYQPTDSDNETVVTCVQSVLEAADLPAEVEYEHAEYQRVFITVADKEAGALIGRGGANIDALEHLLSRMISQQAGHQVPVQVDVNAYRQREHERLEDNARHLAEKALSSGEEIHLEPMSPRDRRVVHLAVQEMGGLSTYTLGEGPRRHVVIVPEEDEQEPS